MRNIYWSYIIEYKAMSAHGTNNENTEKISYFLQQFQYAIQ